MRIVVVDKNKKIRLNKFIDWFIYILGYTLVLILVSVLFKSIDISNLYFGLFAFLAAIIIYILNKTIKPIIFLLTLPITGLTLGIFYPFINVIILKMVDFILGNKFETHGIFSLFFVAILISIMNVCMEIFIIKPIISRGDKNGSKYN